jgi:cytochrome c peroxidase
MSWEAFGREPDFYVIPRAISTFERSLLSGNSPYDAFNQKGDGDALSEAAKRGMQLFFSNRTACGNCHNGFNFTNYAFENNGLYEDYPDPGRFRLTGKESDRARFKVPTLRNIAVTAPYMHDGSIATLEEVLGHYDSGGAAHPNKSAWIRPIGLSPSEKSDIIAFLHSLTDQAFIQNEKFRPE